MRKRSGPVRVGQNRIYTQHDRINTTQEIMVFFCQKYRMYPGLARALYIRCFWQGNHRINGHVRCIYTVLVNPTNKVLLLDALVGLCTGLYPVAHNVLPAFDNLNGHVRCIYTVLANPTIKVLLLDALVGLCTGLYPVAHNVLPAFDNSHWKVKS